MPFFALRLKASHSTAHMGALWLSVLWVQKKSEYVDTFFFLEHFQDVFASKIC